MIEVKGELGTMGGRKVFFDKNIPLDKYFPIKDGVVFRNKRNMEKIFRKFGVELTEDK